VRKERLQRGKKKDLEASRGAATWEIFESNVETGLSGLIRPSLTGPRRVLCLSPDDNYFAKFIA
jgi:hypothetical protein